MPKNEQDELARMQFIHEMVEVVLSYAYRHDPRAMHFALLIFQHEGRDALDRDLVRTEVVSTIDREMLHEMMRDWLHRMTQ